MNTKTLRIAAGTLFAVALIAVLTISTTGSQDHTSTTMDHSSMDTNNTSPPRAEAESASVDDAFVRQMITHHQLAVEMAKIARQNARHQQIKTLAAAIISAQNKEIQELRSLAKQTGVDLSGTSGQTAGDARAMGISMNDMGMGMDMHGFAEADPFDRAFIDGMIPHHQGAIAMAKAELARGADARLKKLATGIITAQEREIAQMKQWRGRWYGSAQAATSPGGASGMDDMPGM